MKIDKNNVKILSKGDDAELLILSKGVVVCLEIITAFSIDGKYIPSDIPVGRMSSEQANELNMVLFGKLTRMAYNNPKKLAKLKSKKILKAIRSAHDFIIGIYRNGTPDYCAPSMRVDETISDEELLEQFSLVFKERLIKGTDFLIEFRNKYIGE